MRVIANEKWRRWLGWLIPLCLLPLLVWLGAAYGQKQYLLVSFAAAILSLVLFMTGFERRQTGSRRLVLVAGMTALSIVGRMIPILKPVTALTMLTGMYLGGEAGFLTGALSALLSNFIFGQGPWTPFQMLAWGMIGLGSGWLAKPLKASRGLLLGMGALTGLLYSLLMDVWSTLWYADALRWELYWASAAAALPHTVAYCLSNVLFLWLLATPIGEKLERVHIKYGV